MNIFKVFADAVLTSTHNVCFGSKIRKVGIPLQTPVFFYTKVKGEYVSRTCFPDDEFYRSSLFQLVKKMLLIIPVTFNFERRQ